MERKTIWIILDIDRVPWTKRNQQDAADFLKVRGFDCLFSTVYDPGMSEAIKILDLSRLTGTEMAIVKETLTRYLKFNPLS